MFGNGGQGDSGSSKKQNKNKKNLKKIIGSTEIICYEIQTVDKTLIY